MERLPLSFRDGSDPAAQSWFDAVSEERRVLGATMDLLSEFADRTPRNLMLNAGGTLRLIDVDSAFGAWRRRSLVHASAFFPGLRLGYRLPQERFDSLPPPVRAGVARLADSEPAPPPSPPPSRPCSSARSRTRAAGRSRARGLARSSMAATASSTPGCGR
jgi:hypothetical protein